VDFDRAAGDTTGTVSIGFRQGKVYHWDSVPLGQASYFFPASDFTADFTLTDALDISNALDTWNSVAKKTFLARPADRTTSQSPASALVWNGSGKVDTTCTITMSPAALFTLSVVAANGKPPTGPASLSSNQGTSHTLVPSDNGILTFQKVAGGYGPSGLTTGLFSGDSHFNGSSWAHPVSTITVPVETGSGLTAVYSPHVPPQDESLFVPLYAGTIVAFGATQVTPGTILFTYTLSGGPIIPRIAGLAFSIG